MESKQSAIQSQKLAMTQQMHQAIKILQLSTYDLNEYLEDQLMSNPMLDMPETVEKQSIETAFFSKDVNGSGQYTQYIQREKYEQSEPQRFGWKEHFNANDYSNHDHFYYEAGDIEHNAIEHIPYEDSTLIDYMMLQLNTSGCDEEEYRIAKIVIEALDDAGYLTAPLNEIAEEAKADIADIERAVRTIQQFDPPGVGAKNLQECLLIQIDQLAQSSIAENAKSMRNVKRSDRTEFAAYAEQRRVEKRMDLKLPRKIVEYHLKDLADNKLSNITRKQNVSTMEAQRACDFIKALDPKPGKNFKHDEQTEYIIPDIIIEEENGDFIINISENTAPRLSINQYYNRFLSNKKTDEEITKYLNEKLNSAMWLIKSVEQRRGTIQKLVESILSHQRDFFENGKAHLKHLTLKQVADDLGAHISTVSRAASNKYLMCKYGVFGLKYFFNSGVPGGSEHGSSAKSIQEVIGKIVKAENPKQPVTDKQLVERLTEYEIKISRRTAAKYRMAMNIQSAAKRKRY